MEHPIPIQNLYYLLCYAWDQLKEGEIVDIAAEDSKNLTELLARVLANGTERLVRRGFDRGYLVDREETPRPRGRMDLTGSMERLSWLQGRMVCEFDELSQNVLQNRILKTTLEDLWYSADLGVTTRALVHRQLEVLRHVERIRVTARIFRRVQLHRNNRYYRFLLNVCELLYHSKLPEQRAGQTRFRDFFRDPSRMPKVFEKFVRNFYFREQQEFEVSSIQLKWRAAGSQDDLAVLPVMQTDVSLKSTERSIILDCKFYKEAMTGWRGGTKVHAGNLYQIYAYLRNAEKVLGWQGSEGILLYPAVGASFDHRFMIDGHPIRVASVDLNKPWQRIHERLLQVIEADGLGR